MKISISVLLLCLIKIAIALDHKIQTRQLKNTFGMETKAQFIEFKDIIAKHGYQAEHHNLTTEDGYNLQISRISESPSSPKAEGKPVVLIEHGLGASSNVWILFNRSLAFALADAGYDVWLGNSRGNYYGRSHKTISPEEPRFWNFSFHEIGKFDYPATIDYILNVTKKSTLSLVGHSLGGTAQIILLSDRPEYNAKVNVAIALAPVVYFANGTAVRSLLKALYAIKGSIDPAGMGEIMSTTSTAIDLMDICMKYRNISRLCLKALLPPTSGQSDMTVMISLFNQLAAGTSTKCIWHYYQLAMSDQFRQYDYEQDNAQYYGQGDPPNYNLQNVMTKMVIMYAETDPYCNKEGAMEIAKQMKEATLYKVDYSQFSHDDFFLAKDLKTLVNDKIIEFITKHKE